MDVQNKADPIMTEEKAREIIIQIKAEFKELLFGLDYIADKLLLTMLTLIPYTDKLQRQKLLAPAHALLTGGTGVGKTDSVNCLAMTIGAKFQRVQCLPSHMPEDILGYETIVENLDGTRSISFLPGPLFCNILLLDEDNRMPAKTKAVILEAMEERSVTLKTKYGDAEEFILPVFPISGDPKDVSGPRYFIVLGTQNIFGEEEGTYPNPVAELDRYTLNISMNDPENESDEMRIRSRNVVNKKINQVAILNEIFQIGRLIQEKIKLSGYADQYITRLLRNTRPHRAKNRELRNFLRNFVKVGASPRVNYHLEAVVRTVAFFAGESLATSDHVKEVAKMVIAHRLVLVEGKEYELSEFGNPKEYVFEEILRLSEVPPWPDASA